MKAAGIEVGKRYLSDGYPLYGCCVEVVEAGVEIPVPLRSAKTVKGFLIKVIVGNNYSPAGSTETVTGRQIKSPWTEAEESKHEAQIKRQETIDELKTLLTSMNVPGARVTHQGLFQMDPADALKLLREWAETHWLLEER